MIDVYVLCAAMVLAAVWAPWVVVRRFLPRVGADPNAIQRDYERGYRLRTLRRLVLPILLVYAVVRAAVGMPDGASPPSLTIFLFAGVGGAFVLSYVAAIVWRYRWDRAFVRSHPEFAGSVQPLGLRLLVPATLLVVLGLLGLTTSSEATVAVGGLVAAVAVLVVGQRLALAALVRSRVELPLESPFGRLVADTVARFGFTPKRVIVVPTTVANAAALSDGTVLATTAMRAIATDEEIAAVLAHELSHARDRDARRIRRSLFFAWIVATLLTAALSIGVAFLPGGRLFGGPVAGLAMVTFMSASIYFRSPMLHRMEFKCDQDAAGIGLGSELARGLAKLHAYAGQPRHWVGIERRLMTHPSLDDRLAALDAA